MRAVPAVMASPLRRGSVSRPEGEPGTGAERAQGGGYRALGRAGWKARWRWRNGGGSREGSVAAAETDWRRGGAERGKGSDYDRSGPPGRPGTIGRHRRRDRLSVALRK